MFQKLLFPITFFAHVVVFAQTYAGKLIDSETGQPVPFAAVQANAYHGVMSNSEGEFSITIPEKTKADSLTISCLGYKTLQISLSRSFEKLIKLTPEVYNIIPVFLETKKLDAGQIIALVKKNLTKNYHNGYEKMQVFKRDNYTNTIKRFNFTLKESTLENLTQKRIDKLFQKIPKHSVYLHESLSDAVIKNSTEGKYALKKSMSIESKEEQELEKRITNEMITLLEESFKSDSDLIIKSGIIRLTKTEDVDSIIRSMKDENLNDTVPKKNTQKNLVFMGLKDLFINPNSNVDVLNKSGRYEFTKRNFAFSGENWLYVIDFTPKNNAKYKGTLYIDTHTYAVVKAEIYHAQKIYDKHFNMLGITSNSLTYKSIALFKQDGDQYVPSYYMVEGSNEGGIDRPFTVVEKNPNTKGKKRINKVIFHTNMLVTTLYKKEYVFQNHQKSSETEAQNLTTASDFKHKKFNHYPTDFWNEYNILPPEKAVQEIKIQE